MGLIQEYTCGDTKVHLILQPGYTLLIVLLEKLSFHAPKPFFAANHNDRTLLIACHVSVFLLPEIGTHSDHGWIGVAFHSHEISPIVRCISGNLEPKVISILRSNSKRRKDNASMTHDHVVLLPGAFGSSHADVCTCSVTSAT